MPNSTTRWKDLEEVITSRILRKPHEGPGYHDFYIMWTPFDEYSVFVCSTNEDLAELLVEIPHYHAGYTKEGEEELAARIHQLNTDVKWHLHSYNGEIFSRIRSELNIPVTVYENRDQGFKDYELQRQCHRKRWISL